MFEAASRREFDVLLFWSLDRLSREGTVETLNHLQRLTSYGVHWRSFTEQYLDSTGIFREAVIGILAAVAKQERVRISERVQAGLARARKQGRIGGRPKAEDDHKLFQAVQRLRAAGKSIRQIAAEADISTNTVLKLLRAAEGSCVNLQSGLVRAGFSSHTAQARWQPAISLHGVKLNRRPVGPRCNRRCTAASNKCTIVPGPRP